jgi:3-hydroxyisobutyrate dehydrogenase-like beta-hydroxyacid dehydrogenase
VHLGPTGAGHASKLVNQLVYLGYVALFCEAASVGAAYDIDRGLLIDALRDSVAGKPLSTHWEDRLRSGDRTPGFTIARVLKDFRLGAAACDAVHVDAPLVAAALATFERAAAKGDADRDVTSIYKPVR